MNANLAVALVIPWVFWGILIGLLLATGRSWINMLLLPVGITVVILVVAGIASAREAFWASLILHFFLLIFFLWSYIAFVLRGRKEKRL